MMAVGAGALAFALSTSASAASLLYGFEGTNQLGNCALNQCFRSPDTMGAVGTTQFLETSNGSIQVYSKTGTLLQTWSMPTFWSNAGLPGGALGDQRVMFDTLSNRWIMVGFGATGNIVNVGVSATDDALGAWSATAITVLPSGTADYPTLAIDRDAVYIGTNNFTPGFTGTSLLVIPRASAFAAGGPTTTNMLNGKIYYAQTVAGVGANAGSSVVRIVVIDSVTKAVLSPTDIGDPSYDFYQGSLAINNSGKRVVGYNRSGFSTADGQISIFARVYDANANGTISQTDEFFIRKSDTNSYRCGALTIIDTTCRQRWGDYAAVSLDPTNNDNFFVVGEYAQAPAVIPNFTTTPRAIGARISA